MDKLLVIGSNSFSGSHFVSLALDKCWDVTGISRSPEPSSAFLPYKQSLNSNNFHFHHLDLNNDISVITDLIEAIKPSHVVNFAAQGMVAESWEHPEHWYQTNVVAHVKLHDRLQKCTFLKKYVHVSTPEVYGSCTGKITESAHYNPSTPYAVSKAACDLNLLSFFRNYKFPVVFTRAANVYGPGQQLYRIIPRTIFFIKLGRKLPLHGGGHSTRAFIHIRDVVDATFRIAMEATPPEIFHLSTDRFISIRDLVRMICDRLGVKFEDVVEITDDRPGKDSAYLLDSTKARTQLNWNPAITLEAGITDTIRWVEDNFEELKKQPTQYIHKA